jgi:hypothetical protein
MHENIALQILFDFFQNWLLEVHRGHNPELERTN